MSSHSPSTALTANQLHNWLQATCESCEIMWDVVIAKTASTPNAIPGAITGYTTHNIYNIFQLQIYVTWLSI